MSRVYIVEEHYREGGRLHGGGVSIQGELSGGALVGEEPR